MLSSRCLNLHNTVRKLVFCITWVRPFVPVFRLHEARHAAPKQTVCSAPLISSVDILSQNQSDFTASGYQRSMRLTSPRLAGENFYRKEARPSRSPNYPLPFVRPLAVTTSSSFSRCLKVHNGSRSCLGSDPGQTNWECGGGGGGLLKRVLSPGCRSLAQLWSPVRIRGAESALSSH